MGLPRFVNCCGIFILPSHTLTSGGGVCTYHTRSHILCNVWWRVGGSGGSDTAGLGGRGGPYRLDKGHKVHQVTRHYSLLRTHLFRTHHYMHITHYTITLSLSYQLILVTQHNTTYYSHRHRQHLGFSIPSVAVFLSQPPHGYCCVL